MTINTRTTLGLWSSLIATLLLTAPLAADYKDTVEKSFSTHGSGLLTLDFSTGPVEIDTYGGSQVLITITRKLNSGSKNDFEKALGNVEMDFAQSGNDITAILKYKEKSSGSFLNWFGWGKKKLSFSTRVQLPKDFDVKAGTSGGSIKLKNLNGEASLHTSGGGIYVDNASGNITARTSGGEIDIDHCRGKLDVRTSGGSIRADRSQGSLYARTSGGGIFIGDIEGDADVSTSGGSIKLGTVFGNVVASTSGGGIEAKIAGQPTEDCVLKTSGGNIRITVDPKINIRIDASTSGGGVNTDLPLSNMELKRSSLKAQLNAGGPTLKARTSGGGIHISST